MKKNISLSSFGKVLSNNGALIALLILLFAGSILFDTFLTTLNIVNILRQSSYMAIMAVGMTFVILTGGIDLSVSSVFGLAGVMAGLVCENVTDNIFALVFIPLAGCAAIGLLNGLIVTKLRITPFIATLAVMMGIQGAGLMLSDGGRAISIRSERFAVIARGNVFGIPVPLIILIFVLVAAMFVAKYTVYGRSCYAVGGNADAAVAKGINVNKTKIITYTLCATLAGIAGLIIGARSGVGKINVGAGTEMDVIAAVVIGGTLLSGGVGKVLNSVFGMIIITVIGNLITKGNFSFMWQSAITGVLLIVILIIQSIQIKSGKALAKK